MRKYRLHKRGVCAGGYDLLPVTLQAIHDRDLDFTIDQQPYLQGFLPVLQMFLYRYSDGLVAPADTNTGLNFVTRETVGRVPDDQEPLRGELGHATGIRSDSGLLPPLNYSPRGVVLPVPIDRRWSRCGSGRGHVTESTSRRRRTGAL